MSTEVRIVPNKASFDRFQFALNEFRMATGISMRDSFIREAGYCCYEFMRYSPPMPKGGGKGLTGQAKKAGEAATNIDIQSLFRPKDDPGAAFQMMGKAVVENDLGAFLRWQNIARGSTRKTANGWYQQKEGRDPRGIFLKIVTGNNPQKDFQAFKNRFGGSFSSKLPPRETTDIAGIHRQTKARYSGRIVKHNGPSLGGNKYLVDATNLQRYIKLKQKMVGWLKAGWANTLYSLPAPKQYEGVQFASMNKVPAWIRRHSGSRGYSRFSGNDSNGNFNLTIGNQTGDNDGVATKAQTIDYVLNVRANKLDKEVMRRLGKYIRAFNAQN
jgi:hypothetical protein